MVEIAKLPSAEPFGRVAKPVRKPKGANPYVALLPDTSKVDYLGWRRYLQSVAPAKAAARARVQGNARAVPPLLADEEEPVGVRGSNDSPANAQRIDGFGTEAAETSAARVLGSLSRGTASAVTVRPSVEDDGAIPKARGTGVGSTRQGIATTGRIGDGPHGRARSGHGDFDFYRVRGQVGHELVARVTTPRSNLDSMVALYDSAGTLLASDDDYGDSLDSLLRYAFPSNGVYYVMTTGFYVFPQNPFRSGSGTGAESQGSYRLRVTTPEADIDNYGVYLRKGDVLGTSVDGSAQQLSILDPSGEEVHGSNQDASFIYPMDSLLPGGGRAVTEHMADETGWHYISVLDGIDSGISRYDVTVEAYRPRLEADPVVQTLYLDFDGARVNTGVWGGPGVGTLSPLSAFLGRWGLAASQEDALIDAIVEEVAENLQTDLAASGLADDFTLRILNSRDDPDPWGQPNVSRVIVGGTIDQSGVGTIGIAQSIDPGNFETEESALVLLDVLSGTPGEWEDATLNTYLRPRSNRVGFVGQAIGNVVSHEAGHFFGDWHVDQFDDQANLMDQGGNFPMLFGVGPDKIGGTADDTDVDFGEDDFNPNEGFTGVEDTLSRLAVVLID